MSFTCSEFPGLAFNSLLELRAIRASRDKVRSSFTLPIVVKVVKETKE